MTKKLLFCFIGILLLAGLIPVAVSADCPWADCNVVLGPGHGSSTVAEVARVQTFIAPVDFELNSIVVALEKYDANPSTAIEVRLWRITYSGTSPYWCFNGPALASKTYDSTLWDGEVHYRQIWATNSNTILEAGEHYAISVECTDGKYVRMQKGTDWGGAGENAYVYCSVCNPWCGTGDGHGSSAGYDLDMVIIGCWVIPAEVITLSGYEDGAGGLVVGGMVKGLGTDFSVDSYIEYGFHEDYLGMNVSCGIITGVGDDGLFKTTLSGVPIGFNISYRAMMVGRQSGRITYGEIKEWTMGAGNCSLSLSVIENSLQRVCSEIYVTDISVYDSLSLNLTWCQNRSDCRGEFVDCEGVVVSSNVTGEERFEYCDYWSFEDGETYYLCAYLVDNTTIIARSNVVTMIRYDASKPGWYNWLNDIIGGLGGGDLGFGMEWVWWLLMLCGMVLVVVVASKMRSRKAQGAVGVFGTILLLGFAAKFGLIGAWFVVLLSIVAGFGFYWLFFKKPGAAGGS